MPITVSAGKRRVAAIAEALGRAAQPGDVIALSGDLGAGKTFFAQHLALGLGVPPSTRVTSPTFTVVNEHAGRVALLHADLYRLGHADELSEVGLFERGASGVVVVEWAERFPEVVPAGALAVTLDITGPTTRRVHLDGAGPRAQRLLSAVESL